MKIYFIFVPSCKLLEGKGGVFQRLYQHSTICTWRAPWVLIDCKECHKRMRHTFWIMSNYMQDLSTYFTTGVCKYSIDLFDSWLQIRNQGCRYQGSFGLRPDLYSQQLSSVWEPCPLSQLYLSYMKDRFMWLLNIKTTGLQWGFNPQSTQCEQSTWLLKRISSSFVFYPFLRPGVSSIL